MTVAPSLRQGDLGGFDPVVEGEGQVVVDQPLQGLQPDRRQPGPDGLFQHVAVDGRAQLGQRHPIRHGLDQFQDLGLVADLAQAEVRQHAFFDDGAVEVAAGDIHAAAGVDLARLCGSPRRMTAISSVPPPKSKMTTFCGLEMDCS